MALQDADLLVVNRGGTNYKITIADFKSQVGIMGNVIYGNVYDVLARSGENITINHPAIDLAKSYIVLSGAAIDLSVNIDVGIYVSSRTTTSFNVSIASSYLTGNQGADVTFSYFLIY